jgi:hypothetical protein
MFNRGSLGSSRPRCCSKKKKDRCRSRRALRSTLRASGSHSRLWEEREMNSCFYIPTKSGCTSWLENRPLRRGSTTGETAQALLSSRPGQLGVAVDYKGEEHQGTRMALLFYSHILRDCNIELYNILLTAIYFLAFLHMEGDTHYSGDGNGDGCDAL